MAICDQRTLLQSSKALFPIFHSSIILIIFLLPFVKPLSFSFSEFNPNDRNITYQGDAFSSNQVIQITKNQRDIPLDGSVGRAIYAKPVPLWDPSTGKLTDFMTHFSFIINPLNASKYGDGLAFFLAPVGSDIPPNSAGGHLGLFSSNSTPPSSENAIVAVEFDVFKNEWDPNDDHVGIDVNSIVSKARLQWKSTMKNGTIGNAWISYNSTAKNLSVFLTYAENPIFNGNSSLWYIIDLKEILPEWVNIGFSASTGQFVEIHNILSWEFTSNLEIRKGGKKRKMGLVVGLAVGIGVLICGLGLLWYVIWMKKWRDSNGDDSAFDVDMDDEFEKGTGPKRFSYRELALATNNFSEDGKLGEGGFGGVYKGFLSESNTHIAVKRVSKGSRQGRKEYASEVKIISRLRHRNLVQLIGWCHERGELLLVYEFMHNGSLDSHLFGGKDLLTWEFRYKIANGLASALLYLHEEWEQCVIHRDIKSSNVMLDSGYNAKLGDFGLARLVDHELGSQTTVLAGTMGYLAPECVTNGKASKESDVYSFGVVALEIACGRKPVELKAEAEKVRLVEWVWDLYGRGRLLDAADERLSMEFDEKQVECLMILGLWCAHPDLYSRPSIKQVINVLNFEAPLPNLPPKLPVPMYFAPPIHLCKFSYASSLGTTDSERKGSPCSCSTCTTHSSKSAASPSSSSSAALLKAKNSHPINPEM